MDCAVSKDTVRTFRGKGMMVNDCFLHSWGWKGQKQGSPESHHPLLALSYGDCEVVYTRVSELRTH